jgi:predicted acyltransferase
LDELFHRGCSGGFRRIRCVLSRKLKWSQQSVGLTGIVTPAISAIGLGIVGRQKMSSRIGRNHRYKAAGNAITAGLMGTLANNVGKISIFLAAAVMARRTWRLWS